MFIHKSFQTCTVSDKLPYRLVGDTISWAKPHPDSKRLLERAIAKGYIIRHDAFGMTGYYEQWEKDFARAYRYRLPIIMEGWMDYRSTPSLLD